MYFLVKDKNFVTLCQSHFSKDIVMLESNNMTGVGIFTLLHLILKKSNKMAKLR